MNVSSIRQSDVWRLRTRTLDVRDGLLMGIVNVTPDSFSDGGELRDHAAAVARGVEMVEQGATIIDVGGESTRPGADPVDEVTEMARVLPVVEGLSERGLIVSIDTAKAAVARAAIEAGAELVNDVTAGSDAEMAGVLAATGAGGVLMHMKGTPRTMQDDPRYEDVVTEVRGFLSDRIESYLQAGVVFECLAVDPGIGFGKTVEHNLELIAGVGELATLGRPLVLGTSRKSFLGKLADIAHPAGRDGVTAVTTALGFERGARVFRVHDIPASRGALAVVGAIVATHTWDV